MSGPYAAVKPNGTPNDTLYVPEPSAIMLLVIGLAGAALVMMIPTNPFSAAESV